MRRLILNKSRYPEKPCYDACTNNGKEAGLSKPQKEMQVEALVRSSLASWRVYHFEDTSDSCPYEKNIRY